MKRNAFIRSIFAIGALTAIPINVLGSKIRELRNEKGFMVGSNKDRFNEEIRPFNGDTFFTKISTKDTNGGIYVFESIRLNNGGPGQHFHYDQDEWWYVLNGEFTIKVGEDVYEAKAGDSVFGPRRVPHVWTKTGEGEGRLLMYFQPAGKMEAYFKAVSDGKLKGMTVVEQNEFRKAHGFEMTGPTLGARKL